MEKKQALRAAQGVQLYLIHRILEQRPYQRSTLAQQSLGTRFSLLGQESSA